MRFTARSRRLRRKMTIAATAAVVCLLSTAYAVGTFAGPTGPQQEVVPVSAQSPDQEEGAGGHYHDGGDEWADDQDGDDQGGDGQGGEDQGAEDEDRTDAPGGAQNINGNDVLGRDCTNSPLPLHDGFQAGARCVETEFGEVSEADKGPQLLITDAPRQVGVGQDFELQVSTRNLVRDRFLKAANGGYYLERSFLDDEGLQRGHFHSACRMLETTDTAPEPAKADFFLATEDQEGGEKPDTVAVPITGLDRPGTVQCAVWAGDGSHRIPMMELVDQIPAFDTVRITVG